MTTSSYLQVALEAVKAAEQVINNYYTSNVRAELKSDQSPVTIADQEAEQLIRQVIHSNFPEHDILGEEAGKTDHDANYLWIIDPIDGTKNYLRQIPLFATQLALMKDGQVIVGVSNAPALGELMYAEKGQGTYFNGEKVQVSAVKTLAEAYMSYGSIGYFEQANLLPSLLNLDRDTLVHRGIGDFWSYHLLAQGKIDIMLEARTRVWDIAAVSLIVEEAGGKVTDLLGQRVSESTTSIIATNGHLHQTVAGYFG